MRSGKNIPALLYRRSSTGCIVQLHLQVSAAVTAYVAHGHRLERLGFAADHRPHSSSANRFTAGASGFLLLIQSGDRHMTLSTARPFLLLKSVAGNSVADGAEGSLGVFRGCCCDKEQVRS